MFLVYAAHIIIFLYDFSTIISTSNERAILIRGTVKKYDASIIFLFLVWIQVAQVCVFQFVINLALAHQFDFLSKNLRIRENSRDIGKTAEAKCISYGEK